MKRAWRNRTKRGNAILQDGEEGKDNTGEENGDNREKRWNARIPNNSMYVKGETF